MKGRALDFSQNLMVPSSHVPTSGKSPDVGHPTVVVAQARHTRTISAGAGGGTRLVLRMSGVAMLSPPHLFVTRCPTSPVPYVRRHYLYPTHSHRTRMSGPPGRIPCDVRVEL
jgi:hypothetical protein